MKIPTMERWPVCLTGFLPLLLCPFAPVLLGSFAPLLLAAQQSTQPAPLPPPWNVLLLLADDMRADELQFMPFTSELSCQAVTFANAFVSTPLCCPMRAGLHSGGYYAKHSGVLNNEQPDGGMFAFHEGDSLAVRVQAAGWRTGLFGKYMNLYKFWTMSHPGAQIPPGWSSFCGGGNQGDWSNWALTCGSSTPTAYGPGVLSHFADHPDDRIAALTSEFIAGAEPFAAFCCFMGPHTPAVPAVVDICRLEHFAPGAAWAYRGRGFGEEDLGDKPLWLQAAVAGWDAAAAQELELRRLRCLLAIDRQVEALFNRLSELGRLERTLIVFASDNGFQLGEHRLGNKGMPYEESIRVPLLLWYHGCTPQTLSGLVSLDVDLPATLLDWIGLPQFAAADGIPLRPMMEEAAGGRAFIYAQAWPDNDDVWPGWTALRDADSKLVRWDTEEGEFYDLSADPFELENAIDDANYAAHITTLGAELESVRGLSLKTQALPAATRNAAYGVTLDAWGGTPPYVWSKYTGTLPSGLTLSSGGVLSGTPTLAGAWTFTLRVTDSSSSPQHGGPQRASRAFTLTVTP